MRKYIYTMVAALLIMGCKDTNENLVQERGVAVVPVMSDPAPAYFTDEIESSYVQFNLSLAQGDAVDKAEIEVTRGDSISAILEEVAIPVTGLKVTAAEVLKALNISENDYKVGDVFTLYVLTTKDGKVTRSPAAFTIPVNCYFDQSMLVGNFDWESEDWGETGSATMEADPGNPYKIYMDGIPQSEGVTGNGNKIQLNINPNNFKITGPKVTIADEAFGYHNYSYEPVGGSYNACDNAYTIIFSITVDEGSFGNYTFVFTNK